MSSLKNRLGAATVAAFCTLALHAGQASAEDAMTTVHFGSVGGLTDAGIYLADEFGYFDEVGIEVQRQRIPNAPALTAAIATGQIDVAGISVTPGLFTSIKQGFSLRIVGDKQSYRPGGFVATQLTINPELAKATDRESIQALKGKKIAISAVASIATLILDGILEANGLARDDVELVEMSYPNMVPALSSGAIDAAILLEPFLTQGRELGVAKVIGDPLENAPGRAPVVVPLVYSEDFAANSDLAGKFMLAYMRGVRAYNDAFRKGIRKDEVIGIIARGANVDEKIVREGYPAGLGPNQEIDMEALQAFQQFFVKEGQVREPIDVSRLVDPSFAEAAVEKLGRYEEDAEQ